MLLDFEIDNAVQDDDGPRRNSSCSIRITDVAIEIGFAGHGESAAEDGMGSPVVIELREGVPHVIVFGDINSEEPTHLISLAGAAESLRRE